MSDARDPLLDSEVGRYRLVRLIGHGGMGRVYEGVRFESGTTVAIKVLGESYAGDASLIDRFFAEARATSMIAHENIVKVHDLATLPDGRPYIVMERLVGRTLREIIEGATLPVGGVLEVMLEVLSALAAVHAKGIVHRDLKPENIFVTGKGRTKVLDFGIAKLTGAHAIARTQTGVVLGTPEYMAPEQITHGITDARGDLYALGIVLFEALTGRRPFEAASDFELMRAHVELIPPRPRARRPELPPGLDDIVACALAKDARERFASAKAMANALRQVATEISMEQWRPLVPGGRLMSPKPPSIPPPIEMPSNARRAVRDEPRTTATVAARPSAKVAAPAARRRWWPVVLAAGVAAACVAGVLFAIARTESAPSSRRVEVAANERAAPAPEPQREAEQVDDEPAPPTFLEVAARARERGEQVARDRRRRAGRTAPAQPAARPQPSATPPQLRDQQLDVPGIDRADFDWRGFLSVAERFARKWSPDAELVLIMLTGVTPDGRVEIENGTAAFVFRSRSARQPCALIQVLPHGTFLSPSTTCTDGPIRPPHHCKLDQLITRAVAIGAGEAEHSTVIVSAVGWLVGGGSRSVLVKGGC